MALLQKCSTLSVSVLSATQMKVTLNTTNADEWDDWLYMAIPEPAGLQGQNLLSVVREDGRVILLDFNTWKTYRVIRLENEPDEEEVGNSVNRNRMSG